MPNLYPGERHLFSHNYTGIGTNLDKRLDKNDEPLSHSIPVNRIDEISRVHDIGYRDYGTIDGKRNLKGEHVMDRIMVQMLDDLDPNTLTASEKAQKFLVCNGINFKLKMGLGNTPVTELDQRSRELREQDAKEMHHNIVRNFPRRKVIVHHIDDIWSADLVEMPNDLGYHYILTVIA